MPSHGTTSGEPTTRQFAKIVAIFVEAIGTALGNVEIKELLPVLQRNGAILAERLEAMFKQLMEEATACSATVGRSVRLVIDYSKSLADMIKIGEYDWVHPDINAKHFPIRGNGVVDVEVIPIHLNEDMSDDRISVMLKQRGLRDAILPELLAYGKKRQELLSQILIIVRGSVKKDGDDCYGVMISERTLSLRRLDKYGRGCYILAVQEVLVR